MAAEKRGLRSKKMVGGTAISSKPSDSSPSDPFTLLSRTAISSFAEFPSILNKEGSSPEIGTVVYIHGIANKPVASVLKCQWDTALFGAPMGDRTRMAYWVDRDRYPEPEKGSCADKDTLLADASGASVRALMENEQEPEIRLSAAERKIMDALKKRLHVEEKLSGDVGIKVLPLPEEARLNAVRRMTSMRFLRDV